MLSVTRSDILYAIDHCWMVEDPREDEYAFLFQLIQERHRTQFEAAVGPTNHDSYEAVVQTLEQIDQARDRSEEILYWLYLDSELRHQGKTLPDLWETQADRPDD